MRVYFDNAATTPLDPEVLDAMIPVMRDDFGNPSSTHSYGRKVKAHLENSRRTIAKLLNVSPAEITFTSGGTEADNMAIRGSVHHLGVTTIISSVIEHHAVSHTVEELANNGLVKLLHVNLLPDGHVDLNHLESLLSQNTNVLVSLMHGNNEVGNLLNIERVSQLCRQYNALFHSDTVQTMAHYSFDFQQVDVDFAVGAAHKFNGPKGVGFLYHNKRIKIHPMITGGSQERELRAGTENIYGIVGLAKAMEIAYRDMSTKSEHIKNLKSYIIDQVKLRFPTVKFNGDAEGQSLYTVLNLAFPPELANEMLLFNFDLNGIAISGGSACTSGSNTGSHVIRGIGKNLDHAPVRLSFGKNNTFEEADFVLNYIGTLFQSAQSI
ncbi:MAG: cysteine desulfurase family protein [Chitinophagaceae bacterium]